MPATDVRVTSSTSGPAEKAATRKASPWIRSAGWDGFWMMSGFWVPTLMLLLPLALSAQMIVGLTLCGWIAHRLSSLYLALCTPEYRQVLQGRPGYFFGLPALMLGLLAAFLLTPESILPIPRFERFLLLAAADYFFSLYHFSVQHYGVLAVYRSKLPRDQPKHNQHDPGQLRRDWWICIGVSGILTVAMDFLNGDLGEVLRLDLPVVTGVQLGLRLGLAGIVAILWLQTIGRWLRRQQGIGRLLYFSTLCYMTIVSFFVDPLLYFAIVQIQHWLVALGLSTHMAANSRPQPDAHPWYRIWGRINASALGPLLVLIALSLLLTPVLEADHFIVHGFSPEALTGRDLLSGLRESIWLYVFGTLAFFSSFVHYLYDRGVYRFKDPLTRKAALKLLKPD